MTSGDRPSRRVVLDACVLYAAPARDLLLRAALESLFSPVWSDEIHAEWTRNLLHNRPDLDPVRIQRTISLMEQAFPDANSKSNKNSSAQLPLPDPQDEHVVRLAEANGASVILTYNERDFPTSVLGPLGLQAIHPDDFLMVLAETNAEAMWLAARRTLAALKNPPLNFGQYAEVLQKCALPKTAQWVTTTSGSGVLPQPE